MSISFNSKCYDKSIDDENERKRGENRENKNV